MNYPYARIRCLATSYVSPINDDFWLEVGNVNHGNTSYQKYLYYILILKLLLKRPICMIKQ